MLECYNRGFWKGVPMTHLSLRVCCLVVVLLTAASPLCAQEMSATQKEVWQMEESFWKNVKDSNANGYASLWHVDFLGWPRDVDHPVGKKELAERGARKMAKGRVISYEILSKTVTRVENVGITLYSVKVVRAGEKGQPETYVSRVTHTWLKTGSTWQILGGMSGPYETSGHTW
jgi:hypothetical protein